MESSKFTGGSSPNIHSTMDSSNLLTVNDVTMKSSQCLNHRLLSLRDLTDHAFKTSQNNLYATEVEIPLENGKVCTQDCLDDDKSDYLLPSKYHPAPHDRWRLVYIIMLIYGMSALLPWNMFITAKAYFEDYKLNQSDPEYRNFFMNYLGITAQLPNFLLSFINLVCHCGPANRVTLRVLWSIGIIIAMFVITIIFAIVDSSTWTTGFFWMTMVVVVIINSANGILQNCIFAIAAMLPMKYINAVILGNNISGVIASLIGIISIAASPNLRIAAIYYFICAVVILVIAFDLYFVLPYSRFYRYYRDLSNSVCTSTKNVFKSQCSTFLDVYKKIWIQLFNVWFIFFITLGIFPAIQAAVRPVNSGYIVDDVLWTPIFCFLSFNFMALLGNFVTNFIKFPTSRFIWIPIVLRGVVFVPFFLLSNYRPDVRDLARMPVVISNDWVYIIGSALHAFLGGYLSSLSMMYAPKLVEPSRSGIAGMMMACALVFGVFSGTLFSLVLAKIFAEFGSTIV